MRVNTHILTRKDARARARTHTLARTYIHTRKHEHAHTRTHTHAQAAQQKQLPAVSGAQQPGGHELDDFEVDNYPTAFSTGGVEEGKAGANADVSWAETKLEDPNIKPNSFVAQRLKGSAKRNRHSTAYTNMIQVSI